VVPGGQRPAERGYNPVTWQPFALFQTSPMAVHRVVPNIVTWNSNMPGTNETYAHYYGTLVYVHMVRIIQSTGVPIYEAWKEAGDVAYVVSLLRSTWMAPGLMFRWVAQRVPFPLEDPPDETVGSVVAAHLLFEMPIDVADRNLFASD
jgi:hypothetical protein